MDLESCKHNLNLMGKWVGSHKATFFPVGMSLYPGQHRVHDAINTIFGNGLLVWLYSFYFENTEVTRWRTVGGGGAL